MNRYYRQRIIINFDEKRIVWIDGNYTKSYIMCINPATNKAEMKSIGNATYRDFPRNSVIIVSNEEDLKPFFFGETFEEMANNIIKSISLDKSTIFTSSAVVGTKDFAFSININHTTTYGATCYCKSYDEEPDRSEDRKTHIPGDLDGR